MGSAHTVQEKGETDIHTRTYDYYYLLLLLRDILMNDTECTPSLRSGDAELTPCLRIAVTPLTPYQ